MRFGFRLALFLAIPGIAAIFGWLALSACFNAVFWYSSCPYQTVGFPLQVLAVTGVILFGFGILTALFALTEPTQASRSESGSHP